MGWNDNMFDDSDDPCCLSHDASSVHETDRALLVEFDGEEHWIPKSVICFDSDVKDCTPSGSQGSLFVNRWWAEKNGFA